MLVRSLLILTCILTILSCGSRTIGYGVLTWPEEGSSYETGDVVPVFKESKIQKTYEIPEAEAGGRKEIPLWRLRLYSHLSDAEAHAAELEPWKDAYGYSKRRGLPIREEADGQGRTVYRLRENQVVKILGRGEEPAQEGVYTDYWYEVLTEDGYRGHCFGELLVVFRTADDPFAEAQRRQSKDERLDHIMSTVWRPEYFREMLDEGRYDLDAFGPHIGLFPSAAEGTVRMVAERYTMEFDYSEVMRYGESTYVFEGSDLRIEHITHGRIAVTFKRNGRLITRVYVEIEEDVEETVRLERDRRAELFEPFAGATLTSNAYGVIRFDDARNFVWEDAEKAARLLLDEKVTGRGRVEFPLYLAPGLRGSYSGALSFDFTGEGRLNFLFRRESGRVRFVAVRDSSIDDMTVTEPPVSPIVLVFEVSR